MFVRSSRRGPDSGGRDAICERDWSALSVSVVARLFIILNTTLRNRLHLVRTDNYVFSLKVLRSSESKECLVGLRRRAEPCDIFKFISVRRVDLLVACTLSGEGKGKERWDCFILH